MVDSNKDVEIKVEPEDKSDQFKKEDIKDEFEEYCDNPESEEIKLDIKEAVLEFISSVTSTHDANIDVGGGDVDLAADTHVSHQADNTCKRIKTENADARDIARLYGVGRCSRCNETFYTQEIYEKHLEVHEQGEHSKTHETLLVPPNINLTPNNGNNAAVHDDEDSVVNKTDSNVSEGLDFRAKLFAQYHCVDNTVTILNCQYEQCDFIYTKANSLLLHQDIHFITPPHKCSLCDFNTSSSGEYNCHILKHTEDDPQRCPYCICGYSSFIGLQNHVRTEHPAEYGTWLSNPAEYGTWLYNPAEYGTWVPNPAECGTWLSNINEDHNIAHDTDKVANGTLINHDETTVVNQADTNALVHVTSDNPYPCIQCNIGIRETWWLKSHIDEYHSTHDSSIFTCQYKDCNFIYMKPDSHLLHEAVHLFKPPLHCPKCNFKARTSFKYDQHILKHTADRPYCCFHCGFCSTSTSGLKRHIQCVHPDQYQIINLFKMI